MGKASSNLLFLAVGAAIGAAIGYIAASDKKDEWLKGAADMIGKIKEGAIAMTNRAEDELDELVDKLDGE